MILRSLQDTAFIELHWGLGSFKLKYHKAVGVNKINDLKLFFHSCLACQVHAML